MNRTPSRSSPRDPATLGELRLTLPGDASAVDTARSAVLAHLAPLDLSARTTYAIELVLEEALMNIALHAWQHGDPQPTELALCALEDCVVIRLRDAGAAFDPGAVAAAEPPADLAHATPGGRGLALMRLHAQRIAYARVDDHNEITIEVART